MKFEEMTPEQKDAWKKRQMLLAEQYQRRAEQKAAIKLADDYDERKTANMPGNGHLAP
jgi:hypothetical protein